MKRTLDVEKVEAALKRAAFRASHGTRAERAGRFLPAKKRRTLPARNVSPERALTRHKA
jgi:hypothetical protein